MSVLLSDSPLALIEGPEDVGPMLQAEEHRLIEILAEAAAMPEADFVRRRLELVKQSLALWNDAEGQILSCAGQIRTAAAQRIEQLLRAG